MKHSLSSMPTTLASIDAIDTPTPTVTLIHITADAVFHPDALRLVIGEDGDTVGGKKQRRAAQLDLDLDDD